MTFLTKIRERQFAKKGRGTYNLSRAVLAGVLAAGCLMPGFAEAAEFAEAAVLQKFSQNNKPFNVEHTPGEKTTTITAVSGIAEDTIGIGWASYNDVEGYTINVKGVSSANLLTITPVIDIRGGYASGGNATSNTVDISNVKFEDSAYIYGGRSQVSGDVTGNAVTINGTIEFSGETRIFGGQSDNSDAAITNNTVTINGTIEFSGETRIFGGQSYKGEVKGNTVTFNSDTVDGITTFTNKNSFIFGGASDKGQAINNTVEINGNTTFNSDSQIYGGWGAAGAEGNSVIISGGNITGLVSGGYSPIGEANYNKVSISGGNINDLVSGGYGNEAANNNSVIISDGTVLGSVRSGYGTQDASSNSVIISDGTIYNNVYGGWATSSSGKADYNKVILVGKDVTYKFTDTQGTGHTLTGSDHIEIKGTVYGYISDGTHSGNEIHVYGSGTNVGGIAGFDKLRFFIDDKMTFGETMLTITGDIFSPYVTISKDNLAVKVTGKPKASDDSTNNTITLIHNESANIKYSNDITSVPVEIGATLSGDGSVALSGDQKDLVVTLNVEVNENGKSLVETRAAAAFVVNNMSDFMLGQGMEQAKAAAGGVTPIDAGTMAPFAAVGGSNMRYTTGSYVDVNGWNGAVGFAKQADKLLFGVAVEHGRGNYDSYLDNGVHASGDIKSTGGVIFGEYKLDNGVHYDAALRAGRVKSDYSSTATSYDESSTYYGFSLGGGKELAVSDKATLDVYGRYYFSHTNGSDVSIASDEEIDFDAVNSHRLRIGGRYTTTLTEKSKAYAGLAWQYEFGGDAKAAINGYSAPTPSLQGHSAIVEAGYKLNAGKNLTLDFNLNGAMGKQRGIGGGIGAQWLF